MPTLSKRVRNLLPSWAEGRATNSSGNLPLERYHVQNLQEAAVKVSRNVPRTVPSWFTVLLTSNEEWTCEKKTRRKLKVRVFHSGSEPRPAFASGEDVTV